jgi:uncharacterized protein with NAD-binding domain and iron-sulfur cluster
MAKVIILGGGVAGMSAAHELINRNFSVEVYDKNPKYVGGKARSVDVPPSDPNDSPLPGEHGFRFFPGFYQHVTATMKEIPRDDGKRVWDNLVPTKDMMLTQATGKSPILMPVHFPQSGSDWLEAIEVFLYTFFNRKKMVEQESGLTTEEMKFFALRIWQLMTSCRERFEEEYEQLSWYEFIHDEIAFGGKFSDDYRKFCVTGLTRSLVACKAEKASLKTVGTIALQLIYLMFRTDGDLGTDMVLNAPTNEAWLTPWYNHLIKNGVEYHHGHETVKLTTENGQIVSAEIEVLDKNGETIEKKTVTGDYFLVAVPIERIDQIFKNSPDIRDLDPELHKNIDTLAPNTEWMNGIMFYLNKKIQLDLYDTAGMNHGHTSYADSSWALTSICQSQFWPDYDLSTRGDGSVVDILSVDISDWEAKGIFNNKPAWDCTAEEIKNEVWAQIKREVPRNLDGSLKITDDMLVDWYLDEAILVNKNHDPATAHSHYQENLEPLLVNSVDTWKNRPKAYSEKITNLLLASDYVQTNTDLASMEAANEAARRAVNRILDLEPAAFESCEVFPLYEPTTSLPYWEHDLKRLRENKKWDGGRTETFFTIVVKTLLFVKKIFTFFKK